jgi:hypothetical protein
MVSNWIVSGRYPVHHRPDSSWTLLRPSECRPLKEADFDDLTTQRMNQDPFKNTFNATRLHRGSNNNPVGGSLWVSRGLASLKVHLAAAARNTVFWTTYIPYFGDHAFPSDPSKSHIRETPDIYVSIQLRLLKG